MPICFASPSGFRPIPPRHAISPLSTTTIYMAFRETPRMIFADAGYFFGAVLPDDELHPRVVQWVHALKEPLLATEFVLVEVIDGLSSPLNRGRAHALLDSLRRSPHIEIVSLSPELLAAGVQLHAVRPDKEWSLTDCISFHIMQIRGITRALAFDHHFEQAGFEALLRLSRGEKHGTARARLQILANSYEAVVGAIYLDQGYEAAKQFIEKTVLATLATILKSGSWMDPKSHLQEASQAAEGHTPIYKVLDEYGPDHDKIFEVGVFVNGVLRGKGSGPSKQLGQQEAAACHQQRV